MNRKDYINSIILNSIIVLSTIISVYKGVIYGAGEGQVGDYIHGIFYFIPYTTDSNILCALASLVMIIFCILGLKGKKKPIPRWATIFKLAGTVSLSLTFVVVLIFLEPLQVLKGRSLLVMYSYEMFFFHLLNPIIAFYSFTCIEKNNKLDKKDYIYAFLPTIIYSIVYIMMVVVLHRWVDFYSFTFGGRNYFIPLVLLFIFGIVFFSTKYQIKYHNIK